MPSRGANLHGSSRRSKNCRASRVTSSLTQKRPCGSVAPMHAEPFPSTLAEFRARYPDEASCRRFLIGRRWPDGFVCAACGRRVAYEITRRVPSRASRVANARGAPRSSSPSAVEPDERHRGHASRAHAPAADDLVRGRLPRHRRPGRHVSGAARSELGLTNRTTACLCSARWHRDGGRSGAALGDSRVAGTVLPPRGRGPDARRAPDLPRLVGLLAAVEVLRHLCPDEVGVPSGQSMPVPCGSTGPTRPTSRWAGSSAGLSPATPSCVEMAASTSACMPLAQLLPLSTRTRPLLGGPRRALGRQSVARCRALAPPEPRTGVEHGSPGRARRVGVPRQLPRPGDRVRGPARPLPAPAPAAPRGPCVWPSPVRDG